MCTMCIMVYINFLLFFIFYPEVNVSYKLIIDYGIRLIFEKCILCFL